MKLYMFRTIPLYITRSFSLYTRQLCMSYRFVDRFRAAGSGWNCSSILILLPTHFQIVICIVLLLIVIFCVLFVCKCVLLPGVYPIAVDKYINIDIKKRRIQG
jgi:hypothetical protein